MESYLYIPINSLNFNNILSSESISPQIFYEKRGFGFKRYEKNNLNPLSNSILAYNRIPLTHNIKSDREEFIFYLAVPSNLISKDSKSHSLKDVVVRQLDYTLFINSVECFFVTKTEDEALKLIASTNRSLEVKNVDNYAKNIKSIDDYNFNTAEFDYLSLDSIIDFKTYNHDQIVLDRKVNKIKGFVYGFLSGQLNELPKEIVSAKMYFQEFINVYSLLSNELSTVVSQKSSHNQKNSKSALDNYYHKLQELVERITFLIDIFDASSIESNISEDFEIDIDSLKGLKKYQSKKLKKSLYQIVVDLFKDSNLEALSIEELLNYLLNQSKYFYRNPSKENYTTLENKFNVVRGIISQKFHEIELENSNNEWDNELPFDFNVKDSSINLKSKKFNKNELSIYNIILKEFLTLEELSTADEIGQCRLSILISIGKLSSELKIFDKDSSDLKYLRKLYDSLKTVGVGFKVQDTDDLALQSLACFLNRYSDFEKLKDYMMKNNVVNSGLVMGIWGAAYGYANTSKLVLAPVFRNNNVLIETIQFSSRIATSHPVYEDTLYQFNTQLNKNTKSIKPYIVNKEVTNLLEEPAVEHLDLGEEFIELIISNKKLRGNDEWIKLIDQCFKMVNMEINSGELFDSTNSKLDLFKENLINKSRGTKGFGEAKINEAISEYTKFLNNK